MRRSSGLLLFACFFLLAGHRPLFSQLEQVIREGEPAAREAIEKAGKDLDREFEKYFAQPRDYYGWFASNQVKQPFNALVDSAIVRITRTGDPVRFRNPGNRLVVETLAAENRTIPLSQRLVLTPQDDTLKVSRTYGSGTATVKMDPLKEYISEAIKKIAPFGQGHLTASPDEIRRWRAQDAARPIQMK